MRREVDDMCEQSRLEPDIADTTRHGAESLVEVGGVAGSACCILEYHCRRRRTNPLSQIDQTLVECPGQSPRHPWSMAWQTGGRRSGIPTDERKIKTGTFKSQVSYLYLMQVCAAMLYAPPPARYRDMIACSYDKLGSTRKLGSSPNFPHPSTVRSPAKRCSLSTSLSEEEGRLEDPPRAAGTNY